MPNRLADEASPYLRQHADNPIAWQPWGERAFEQARAEHKPVLLSVGYAACHWCHVMAHESFEDPAVGAWLDEHVVCVKVDREERPDVDALYMSAVQAFTGGHGGWPMTLFLLPDGRPFLGGTYFPPAPRHGLPSFTQLAEHALHLFHHDPDRRDRLADQATDRVQASTRLPQLAVPDDGPDWLAEVVDHAVAAFDETWGGFGGAPKFPPHGTLLALLTQHERTGDPTALQLAVETLHAMARGGTYDLLDGGFCRYSVDAAWRIPHFEKMLYDNAQLVPVLIEAGALADDPSLLRVAVETIDYVTTRLSGDEGGFLSSEDADSEGVEGRFYAWTPAELDAVLGEDAASAARLLQVTATGTFEHGSSVLRLERPLEAQSPDDQALLRRALPRLREARAARVRPGLDDKRVTAWTALMAEALARSAVALDRPQDLARAEASVTFLLDEATVDGRLMRVWKDGRARHLGVLDDHAALLLALIALYEATWSPRWLDEALALAETTWALFSDPATGVCFDTGHDAPALIARPRRLITGAEPGGNGMLALGLAQLATLNGEAAHGVRADGVIASFGAYAVRAPLALGVEAVAWAWRHDPVREVAVVLPHAEADASALRAVLRAHPDRLRVVAGCVERQAPAAIPWLADKPTLGGQPTAYVCQRGTCSAPVATPGDLAALLTR